MPNTTNIDLLILHLQTIPPDCFEMSIWMQSRLHRCDTVGCLGGWIDHLSKRDNSLSEIAEWLGVDRDTSWIVTHLPQGYSLSEFDARPAAQRIALAIEMLERLRDTGECHWASIIDDNPATTEEPSQC